MTIRLLKLNCSKCGAPARWRSGSGGDVPDQPDVPWIGGSSWKRFDLCVNGHYFNIRPYADYDEHYIYEGEVKGEIDRLGVRLADLQELLKS